MSPELCSRCGSWDCSLHLPELPAVSTSSVSPVCHDPYLLPLGFAVYRQLTAVTSGISTTRCGTKEWIKSLVCCQKQQKPLCPVGGCCSTVIRASRETKFAPGRAAHLNMPKYILSTLIVSEEALRAGYSFFRIAVECSKLLATWERFCRFLPAPYEREPLETERQFREQKEIRVLFKILPLFLIARVWTQGLLGKATSLPRWLLVKWRLEVALVSALCCSIALQPRSFPLWVKMSGVLWGLGFWNGKA